MLEQELGFVTADFVFHEMDAEHFSESFGAGHWDCFDIGACRRLLP